LIITDRNTVPVSLGDVRLTFAETLEIPGEVVYVHPLHNLAVVHYDPKLIGTTPVQAARLSTRGLRANEAIDVIGLDGNGEIKSRSTAVAGVDPLLLPLSRSVGFRDDNLETATLVNPPDDIVGVLADPSGEVRGLWASFATDNGRSGQRDAADRAQRRAAVLARGRIRTRVAGDRPRAGAGRPVGAAHRAQ